MRMTVELSCPLCDADLVARIDPGSRATWDEPATGWSVLELTGCHHADQYDEGIADAETVNELDHASGAALDDSARTEQDDADAAREDADMLREETP